MSDSTTVYVSRSGFSDVYHTTPDCRYLPDDSDAIRETTADAVEPFKRLCKQCEGPLDQVPQKATGGSKAHYQAAKDA